MKYATALECLSPIHVIHLADYLTQACKSVSSPEDAEVLIDASVNRAKEENNGYTMSQRLRDDIANAYEKQLHLVYRKEHNVQPAVDYIMSAIQNDEFDTLVATAEQYETLSIS